MDKELKKGCGKYKPYFVIDKKTGKLIPAYLPEDAVVKEAKPGEKAGNYLIDEINEQLHPTGLMEKLKELYKK